jgi:hypothetical protein
MLSSAQKKQPGKQLFVIRLKGQLASSPEVTKHFKLLTCLAGTIQQSVVSLCKTQVVKGKVL